MILALTKTPGFLLCECRDFQNLILLRSERGKDEVGRLGGYQECYIEHLTQHNDKQKQYFVYKKYYTINMAHYLNEMVVSSYLQWQFKFFYESKPISISYINKTNTG